MEEFYMNEITKFQNKLNTVNFTGFGKVDSNLFFAICTKTKNQGTKPVRMTFKEIRDLSGFKDHSNEALIDSIEQTYKKMLNLNLRIGDDVDFTVFSLFHRFDVIGTEQYVEVRCTDELEEVLNDWTGEWTAFRLDEYVNLKSTYSKHMYRLLKQWRTIGGHAWKIDEWRELLEVPETYTMDNINQRVLKPILKELPDYFVGLNVEKIKTGRSITALKFNFQAEDNNYGEYNSWEDSKSKAEKIKDIKKKERSGTATPEMSALKDQIQNEKDWMEKNDIPDSPKAREKKSLFSRFFKK